MDIFQEQKIGLLKEKNLSSEIWATAQLLPGEGIEDGTERVEKLLMENFGGLIDGIKELLRHHDGTEKYWIARRFVINQLTELGVILKK